MEQMAALRFDIESVQCVPTRKRRPVGSPVALSRLVVRAIRAVHPFIPLALLAIVFGLSLGVVQVVERTTPPHEAPVPQVSAAPDGP